jgi:hypothetical protein
MNAGLRDLVRQRAGHRCEYCGLLQEHLPLIRFHIDHVQPKKHGGNDDPLNLALACHSCNLHKGTNLAGIDPENGYIEPLFHPRNDPWETHFERRGVVISGRTPKGRVTVQVLNMNDPENVQLRTELIARGQLK